MASCNNCGSTILFGGKKAGNYRFCSQKCFNNGQFLVVADQLPQEVVAEHTKAAHSGECPKCHKANGPVDVHTTYKVWSAAVLTSWVNQPQVSCRSCGIKAQATGTIYSLLLGWWGVPWGILMTPVQILRNIFGILKPPAPEFPSKKLEQIVRINLGKQVYMQHQEKNNA